MANRRLCDWPAACDETLLVSLIGLSPEEDVILDGYTLSESNSATYVPHNQIKRKNGFSLEKVLEIKKLKPHQCHGNVTSYGFLPGENVTKSLSTTCHDFYL
jgi:hypothetical protein